MACHGCIRVGFHPVILDLYLLRMPGIVRIQEGDILEFRSIPTSVASPGRSLPANEMFDMNPFFKQLEALDNLNKMLSVAIVAGIVDDDHLRWLNNLSCQGFQGSLDRCLALVAGNDDTDRCKFGIQVVAALIFYFLSDSNFDIERFNNTKLYACTK